MERVTWKGHVLPGQFPRWKKAHDEIWPEMTRALDLAGIHNYTIWAMGDDLFGYYECKSRAEAERVQAESSVVSRWNDSMRGIMEMDIDPVTGVGVTPELVFYHK